MLCIFLRSHESSSCYDDGNNSQNVALVLMHSTCILKLLI